MESARFLITVMYFWKQAPETRVWIVRKSRKSRRADVEDMDLRRCFFVIDKSLIFLEM